MTCQLSSVCTNKYSSYDYDTFSSTTDDYDYGYGNFTQLAQFGVVRSGNGGAAIGGGVGGIVFIFCGIGIW